MLIYISAAAFGIHIHSREGPSRMPCRRLSSPSRQTQCPRYVASAYIFSPMVARCRRRARAVRPWPVKSAPPRPASCRRTPRQVEGRCQQREERRDGLGQVVWAVRVRACVRACAIRHVRHPGSMLRHSCRNMATPACRMFRGKQRRPTAAAASVYAICHAASTQYAPPGRREVEGAAVAFMPRRR